MRSWKFLPERQLWPQAQWGDLQHGDGVPVDLLCPGRLLRKRMHERVHGLQSVGDSRVASFQSRPHEAAKIVVTYTGTLHKSSSARYYLDALDALPEEFRARFETRFIGRITEDEAKSLQNRKTAIRQFDFMAQAEAFRWIEETDYLLVTMMHAGKHDRQGL